MKKAFFGLALISLANMGHGYTVDSSLKPMDTTQSIKTDMQMNNNGKADEILRDVNEQNNPTKTDLNEHHVNKFAPEQVPHL